MTTTKRAAPSDGGGPKHNNPGKGKDKGKGKGKKLGNTRYGAYAGYKGVKERRARKLVNAELNPLLRALKREIGQAKRLHERTRGDLKHIYGETGRYIKGQNQGIEQAYGRAGSEQKAAQAALMSQLGQNYNQSSSGVNNEMARLGISDPAFLGQLQGDQANAVRMAQQTGANDQSNMQLSQLGMNSVGSLLLGMNRGQRASQMGQALNARNNAIFDVRGQQRELRQQRPELVRQMLEQMAAQGWGQYVDQRNLNQQQQQINMQRQDMRHDNALQSKQYGNSQAQQNAYNSTLSGLAQQQLANTYKGKKNR